MPTDRFYIGYTEGETGLNTYFKPYAIPDTAYAALDNAYVFRGRVKKRFGSLLMSSDPIYGPLQSRLRVQVGVTTGGTLAGIVDTITASAIAGAVGQGFSVDINFFTVWNPAAGANQMLRTDNLAAPATYNLATTAFNITGVAVPDNTPVYFYPSLPVMGLQNFETGDIIAENITAFDTSFAYKFNNGWTRISAETNPGDAVWTGSDTNFFWTCTYSGIDASQRVLFATNGNQLEPNYMRSLYANTWTKFRPIVSVIGGNTTYINMALLIIPFQNRLLLLNTWEAVGAAPAVNYGNRCRYSQVGSPFPDTTAFRSDTPGVGNAIDAATSESIITALIIKNRLIVYFEKSTWELVYTGNQALPYVWQQLNIELGAESTFSVVPFDKVAIGVGNVGIHACNGTAVERIDDNIPDEVFNINNNNEGILRVGGIRDYFTEMVYWTLPYINQLPNFPYPNKVLVLNYKTGAWAYNDDSITCFGYYQAVSNVTWASNNITWRSSLSWGSAPLQAQFRNVLAGNQEGYTFICSPNTNNNAPVLQITQITANINGTFTLNIINHNLQAGDYIYLQGIVWSDGSAVLNDYIYEVGAVSSAGTVDINKILIVPQITQPVPAPGVTYIGGGSVARVSKINIKTKEYNFYAQEGRNAYVSKIDFMIDRTGDGQIDANFYVSSSTEEMLASSAVTNTLVGTGTLDTFPYTALYPTVAAPIPLEGDSTRLWHPVYLQADGECIQVQLTMNPGQMLDPDIQFCDFVLHAMVFHAQPTSYRLQ